MVGSGITLSKDGDGFFTGIVTATSYYGDGSNLSNITSTTINSNADNRLITGSGTANTLNGESTLTYDGTNLDLNADSKKLRLGASQDLELYHNGSNSYIDNNTGNLYVRSGGGQILFRPNNSEDALVLKPDGAVELYYDNSKKFETTSGGASFLDNVKWSDNKGARFGGGEDLQLYHDGSNSYIDNNTGTLNIPVSYTHLRAHETRP